MGIDKATKRRLSNNTTKLHKRSPASHPHDPNRQKCIDDDGVDEITDY